MAVLTLRREDGRIVCERVMVSDRAHRRMRGLLGGAAGLAMISFSALLMTWLAVTGGGRAPAHPPRGTLVLGPDVGGILVHAFFWIFAIPLDLVALIGWFVALRALLTRRPS